MAIYKRKNTYWIDITAPSGQRIRQSTRTTQKALAQEFHDRLKRELWEIAYLDKKPIRLFDEALLLFIEEGKQGKNIDTVRRHAIYWRALFQGRTLQSITGEEIAANIPQYSKTGETLSPATKNRYRTSVMKMFSLAYKNDWIAKIPYVPKNAEPKVNVRWISKNEAARLIENLDLPWMKAVCKFALYTGARMSEILSLEWDSVDLSRKIAVVRADKSKSGKARPLPLNDEACTLLAELEAQRCNKYVFHRGTNKMIGRIDWVDFHRALNRAGIENFRFHDLRHTWASWHAQSGTPLYTLKEMGGWQTLEMVNKYAHLNADHLLKYANSTTLN